jgi:hypothetical protein
VTASLTIPSIKAFIFTKQYAKNVMEDNKMCRFGIEEELQKPAGQRP